MRIGNEGTLTTTSWPPPGSSAITWWAPQSENQSLPSCHRGDSPNAIPSMHSHVQTDAPHDQNSSVRARQASAGPSGGYRPGLSGAQPAAEGEPDPFSRQQVGVDGRSLPSWACRAGSR